MVKQLVIYSDRKISIADINLCLPLADKVHAGDPISTSVHCTDSLALKRVKLKSGWRNQLALGLVDILYGPDVLALSFVDGLPVMVPSELLT